MTFIQAFQMLIPLLFIGIVAFSRQPNRLRWGLSTLGFGLVILFMWVSARWDFPTIFLRPFYPLLFILAAIIGYRRIAPPEKEEKRWQRIVNIGTAVFLIVLMLGLNWRALRGYPTPDGAIELVSPLRSSSYGNGRFLVLNGGSSPFINGHARVVPQNYALDIIAVDSLGSSLEWGGNRTVLEDYAIFGAMLYSPCNGTVLIAEDRYLDLIPPATDVFNLAGNHVILDCDGVEVILAHMQKGSVQVAAGDVVTTETVLGRVGNTGNTSEPHLHIHAEQGGVPGNLLDGKAVPILLNGRFLVRNQLIE
ncbi:MAG: M23 family metallopeptidase [Chloroflexota bacterium]